MPFTIQTARTKNSNKSAPPGTQTSSINDTAPATDDEDDRDICDVKRLCDHKVTRKDSTVMILVEWDKSTEKTWEAEHELQATVPDLLYDFWKDAGGRSKATGLETFHVFRLHMKQGNIKANNRQFLVQWVGYSDEEVTWEMEDFVREIAPVALDSYLSQIKKA